MDTIRDAGIHPGRDVQTPRSARNEDAMIDPGTSTDGALVGHPMDADDAKAEKKRSKAAKKEKSEDGKSAEREQKLRWDADKIQLKWVRLAILMASIGIGADRTMQELSQVGSQPGDLLVLRAIVQLIALVGLAALAIATFQHGRLLLAVVRDEPIPVARFPLSLIVAVIIVLLGLIAVAMAATNLGSGGRSASAAPSTMAAAGPVVIAVAATVAPPSITPDLRTQVQAVTPPASPGVGAAPASATASPPPTPAPSIAPTAAPSPAVSIAVTVVINGTGPAGARLRQAPVDGEIIAVLADGTRLTALENTLAGGQVWQRVRMADDREGWIAADLVVTTDPTSAQP
jgi:uncharacterized membrane protein YidH (DUF202 family)